MTGRGRLAWCSAVATLASASALLPLVESVTWLIPAALLLGAQSGTGIATRRVPLARPLTVLAQVAVSLALFTLLFARSEAVLGVLPGPDAFAHFGSLFAEGAGEVRGYSIPAPVTDGIRLILLTGVTGIGLLVDAFAVTYRSAAPAGLPLLALYSVAAGLHDGATGWLWFLCAAAGFLLLLLAEGRERLSQWGRIFGARARPGARAHDPGSVQGTPVAPVRTGRRIGAVALGVALAVPAALPTLNSGLLENLGGSGSAPGTPSGTVTAVDPLVALQDNLNQPENRTVLTYRSTVPDTSGMYLRIVALDQFDGTAWKASERPVYELPEGEFPAPPGLSTDVRREEVSTTVSAAGWYAQSWLPVPYPARDVEIEGQWRFEPRSLALVGDDGQTTRGVTYEVESLLVQPVTRQLAGAGAPDRELLAEYTRIPDSLPDVVREEALRVTRGAGNAYERAVRLQQWFTVEGGFTYDTQVRAGSGSAAIARFLEQREGFCVHFAFSMAAMSRTLGIPARVAVGFTPGQELADGRMAVGLQDAHAWPELYFEGVGWTRFEPTPSRGSTPDYALPDTGDGGGDDGALEPARPNGGQEPVPEPSESAACSPAERQLDSACGQVVSPPTGGGSDDGSLWRTVLAVSGAVALLLLPPGLPLLWRVRVRARRLRPEAGVLDVWRELLDSAWDVGIEPDEATTPRTAVERVVARGRLGPEAAEAARRVAHAVERHLYAPVAPDAEGLAEDVRRVRAELTSQVSWRLRARALLWPRSAVRLVRAARTHRSALAARGRSVLPAREAR